MKSFRNPVGRDNDAQAKYRDMFAAASKLFFEIDPVGINFESNRDEYDL